MKVFLNFIKKKFYELPGVKTMFFSFMKHYGFTENIINKINDFLSNLQIDIHYINLENPREKPEDISKKFLAYGDEFSNYAYEFHLKDDIFNIDRDINIIKNIFKEAKKAGVYVGITFTNTTNIVSRFYGTVHICHAIYAIPIDSKKFLIRNSWGNTDTNIIVKFEDLINFNTIRIYFLYFNYQNREKKTRKFHAIKEPKQSSKSRKFKKHYGMFSSKEKSESSKVLKKKEPTPPPFSRKGFNNKPQEELFGLLNI
jgi:hypothetical protein